MVFQSITAFVVIQIYHRHRRKQFPPLFQHASTAVLIMEDVSSQMLPVASDIVRRGTLLHLDIER
jgi:hypothetical protein